MPEDDSQGGHQGKESLDRTPRQDNTDRIGLFKKWQDRTVWTSIWEKLD
jgi:hypothetical protein